MTILRCAFILGRVSKKVFDFLGDMLPPLPLAYVGTKEKSTFFSFFINISLEPVLRLGVTIQKKCFYKKRFFRACWIFLKFCMKKFAPSPSSWSRFFTPSLKTALNLSFFYALKINKWTVGEKYMFRLHTALFTIVSLKL